MELFSMAVQRYQKKWANSSTTIMDEQQWCEHVYQKISIAAIVLFGVNDIHPFQDGNGRTSRIYVNIALKKLLGLPFPVTITATLEQRREYVNALKECRSRLPRIFKRQKTNSGRRSNLPAFRDLIVVVYERILHAVRQANSMIETKTRAAAVEEEARIERRARERAAEGQCVICLDNGPNISTLCCGQVVHMTCLAEWLSNQGSCIACRKPMPRLVQRTRQQSENQNGNAHLNNDEAIANALNEDAENNNNIEETEDTTEDTTTVDETADINAAENIDAPVEETEDTTEDTTTGVDIINDHEESNNNAVQEDTTEDTEENITTEDDTTTHQDDSSSGTAAPEEDTTEDTTTHQNDSSSEDAAQEEDATEETTDDSTEGDTTEETVARPPQASRQSVFCGQCQKNRFAIDCSNIMCGACCQLYGYDDCARHNCVGMC